MPIGNKVDLSKSQKTKGVVKGAVKGAQGKNVAGAVAGGQLTGGAAGAAQALLSQTKGRTILVIVGVYITAPFIIMMLTAMIVISSLLGGTLTAASAGAAQAASASTGVASGVLETVQSAALYTPTPWTILEATIYYETGAGASVAQRQGVCPTGAPAASLCPATLAVQPGALTLGSSPQGSAPGASAVSGFDPSVGRNGTVPQLLPTNSPDWTTTNTANWDCIRQAESGDNYSLTSGAYGILASTWTSLGLLGTPSQATKSAQDAAALEILNYEGHFYGAWNDLCTHPGSGPDQQISYISPGVADPSSGSTSASSSGPASLPGYGGGTCPIIKKKPFYYGPYCVVAGTLSKTRLEDLSASSTWVATTVGAVLTKAGDGDSVDLSAGVTLPENEPPQVDPASSIAQRDHRSLIAAFAALPIENNSPAMDENIYELAVSWASGYSPLSGSTCSPAAASTPAATSIPGPANGATQSTDLLSVTQVTLADQIVTDAVSDGASQTTQIAAVTSALALSNLSTSPIGIFSNGTTSVASSVASFVAANKNSTSSADAQASHALGGSISTFTGWIAGATQLVQADSGVAQACGTTVPFVAGGSVAAQRAVQVAEAKIGVPYIWGGGGTNGPSGSATAPPNQVGEPGFDCSGLVQYAFAQAQVALPRTAQDQFNYVQSHSTITMTISQLQPGDLVFFSDNEPGVNHVAIYLGDGNIIQAPQTGQDVSYATLSDDMGLGFLGGGPAA